MNTLIITRLLSIEDEEKLFRKETNKTWFLLSRKSQKKLDSEEVIILPFSFEDPSKQQAVLEELESLEDDLSEVYDNADVTIILAIVQEDYDKAVSHLEKQLIVLSKFGKIIYERNNKLEFDLLCVMAKIKPIDRPRKFVPVISFTEYIKNCPEPTCETNISGSDPEAVYGKVSSFTVGDFFFHLN